MLTSVDPARRASAWPSPVYSHELLVTLNDLPIPPVARITAGAWKMTNLPGLPAITEGAGDGSGVVGQQLGDGDLGEHPQAGVLVTDPVLGDAFGGILVLPQRDDLLLQGADQLQPGAVADMGEPRVFVAAEVALADPAVRRAVEQRPVGLQFPDPVRRLLRVQLGHPRVVQELSAAHGVAEVHLPVVLGVDVAHGRRDAALGHHRVRLAEQRLADDRGPHARPPGRRWRPAVRRRRRR